MEKLSPMATITKKEIVDRIADAQKVNRAVAKQIVHAFLEEIIKSAVAGHRLEFRNFGVFEVLERGPHRAQNPKTLQKLVVPKRRRIRFKAGRVLRKKLDATVAGGSRSAGTSRAAT
jgi:integration host factor subunit beta